MIHICRLCLTWASIYLNVTYIHSRITFSRGSDKKWHYQSSDAVLIIILMQSLNQCGLRPDIESGVVWIGHMDSLDISKISDQLDGCMLRRRSSNLKSWQNHHYCSINFLIWSSCDIGTEIPFNALSYFWARRTFKVLCLIFSKLKTIEHHSIFAKFTQLIALVKIPTLKKIPSETCTFGLKHGNYLLDPLPLVGFPQLINHITYPPITHTITRGCSLVNGTIVGKTYLLLYNHDRVWLKMKLNNLVYNC